MKIIILVLIFLMQIPIFLYSATIYVKHDALGLNNGTSWANAYTSLQSALSAAVDNDKIWVAKGTYKPSYDYGLGGGSRYYHFRMINGVEIYGGFAGTETAVSQRANFGDGGTNETILSGDLNGDDVVTGSGATLSFSNNGENCYHLFYHPSGLGLTSSAVLDGFTIMGGNANGSNPHHLGGGTYNLENSLSYYNCNVKFNVSSAGGGFYNRFSSASLTNCNISYNYSSFGGGLCNEYSTTALTNCKIFGNKSSNYGGGLQNISSTVTLTNCTMYNNNSAFYGGATNNSISTNTTFNNSIIWANSAGAGGDAFSLLSSSSVTLNYSCYTNTGNYLYNSSSTFTATANNITSDPLFADANNGDFRLISNSPCVNTGNNTYNSETYDIRGQARIQNTKIDMGAYEWTSGIDPTIPTVTTQEVSSIATTTATGNGNITSLGLPNPTAHGVVYHTSTNPTTANSVVNNGAASATGAFTASITGLSANTQYFVKAYATNSAGTVYGSEVNFYTLAIVPSAPTVNNATTTTLDVAINVNGNNSNTEFAIQETGGSGKYVQTNATLGTDGGAAVWQTAALWGTKTVTGLSPNTSYTFKVKARNGESTPVETAFSGTASLITLANTPSAMTFVSHTKASIDLQIQPNSNPVGTQYAIYNGSQYLQTNGTFAGTEAWQTETQWESTSGNLRVSSLTSGTAYNWQTKARNENHVETSLSTTLATKTLPNQATDVNFDNITSNSFRINWTRGNGDRVKVFLKAVAGVSASPVDGTNYEANTVFPNGDQIGTTDWYCVYDGTGTNVSITNVNTTNSYIAQAFEYVNFTGHNFNYNTETASGNPSGACQSTVYVDASYNSGTTGWGVTHFANLGTALTIVCSGGTVNLSTASNTSYSGNLSFEGLTVILGSYNFELTGNISAGLIKTTNTGKLIMKDLSANATKTLPITDGTYNYTMTITTADVNNPDVSVRISNLNPTGSINSDFWDIEGPTNLNATITLRVDKSSIAPKTLGSNTELRYRNSTDTRYIPADGNNFSIEEFNDYYIITITHVNEF